MKKYSMIFFIKQSLNGLFMNSVMTVTSVFILTSCLLLMGCFGFFIYNVNINLSQLNELNKIVFFINKDYNSEEEIEKIKNRIEELDNVKQIKVITRKEALDQTWELLWKDYPESKLAGDDAFYSRVLNDNSILAAIEIEYENIDDIDTLEFQLSAIPGYEKLRNASEIARTIIDVKNVIMFVLVWFLVILFVIAIFIILNTVRLSVHSRKNEIIIMRYIGATNFFILFPFLLEGVIIGIVSAAVSYFLQSYIYGAVVKTLERMDTSLKLVDFSEVSVLIFVIFILVGVFCGLLGSSISSQRHLKA